MKLVKSKRYLKKVIESNVYDVAISTPLSHVRFLSKEIENNVLLKREDLQPIFSFKLRGAYNKISLLKKKSLEPEGQTTQSSIQFSEFRYIHSPN